jgi:hypothetical protein
VGSRLLRPELTNRGWKRKIISRGYNPAHETKIKDDGWFFDTELLLLAERMNFLVLDLPVRWKDDPDSRVRIFRTILHDLKGLARMRRDFARGK